MRIVTGRLSLRGPLMIMVALTGVLGAVDAGSVVLTRMSVPDHVRAAGHAAAEVAQNAPATRRTALTAYRAAQDDAQRHGITVRTEDFTIYPDGRVTLTAGKTAPTVLLDRVSRLSDLADVRTTVTVKPLPYSSY